MGAATTRFIYDLHAYLRSRGDTHPQPVVAYTLGRENHDADLTPGQLTRIRHAFAYTDGFGRQLQHKNQAEPGPVPQRDNTGAIILDPHGQPGADRS